MFLELKQTLLLWRIWAIAKVYSLVLRYRRTILGTLWLPAGLVFIVLAKGILFAGILSVPTERIIPNIAVGLLLWRLIAGILTSGCSAFSSFKRDFEAGYYPLFSPIFGVFVGELFIFIHGLIPILLISFFFILPSPSAIFYSLAGMILLMFCLIPVSFLLSILSTRYRDIAPLVASSMRVIYFLTPVLWLPEMAKGNYQWAVLLNPFYHLIEIIRAPLISQPVDGLNWIVVFCIALFCWIMVWTYYRIYRRRILLWL